jgi:hypothetical protein
MNTFKLPFGWMPGHWGLKGKTRLRAQAEYELSGMELDLRLAEIDHADDVEKMQLAKLAVQLQHRMIDEYEHDVQQAQIKLGDDAATFEETMLSIKLAHNRISQQAHDKALADLRGEPWVAMPDIRWDPSDPGRSYFELDYNDHFVQFLKTNNYAGATDDQIVEGWLTDVCRSVAQEVAQEDPSFVSDSISPVSKRRRPRRKKTEYS